MQTIKPGEIYLVSFPFENDPTQQKIRPVAVLRTGKTKVVGIEITSHAPRDSFDVSIEKWEQSHLDKQSTARASKQHAFLKTELLYKVGDLDYKDLINIEKAYVQYQRDFEKTRKDPELAYKFQAAKHHILTYDKEISITRALLKQGHKPKAIRNAILKHSILTPSHSIAAAQAYAIKTVATAERYLKAELAKTKGHSR